MLQRVTHLTGNMLKHSYEQKRTSLFLPPNHLLSRLIVISHPHFILPGLIEYDVTRPSKIWKQFTTMRNWRTRGEKRTVEGDEDRDRRTAHCHRRHSRSPVHDHSRRSFSTDRSVCRGGNAPPEPFDRLFERSIRSLLFPLPRSLQISLSRCSFLLFFHPSSSLWQSSDPSRLVSSRLVSSRLVSFRLVPPDESHRVTRV